MTRTARFRTRPCDACTDREEFKEWRLLICLAQGVNLPCNGEQTLIASGPAHGGAPRR
jgi:hypothetical protein